MPDIESPLYNRRRRGPARYRRLLIVYPICLRKWGQSAGKTGPLTRTLPRPRGRACQRCIIGFLYAHVKWSSRTLVHNAGILYTSGFQFERQFRARCVAEILRREYVFPRAIFIREINYNCFATLVLRFILRELSNRRLLQSFFFVIK